MGNHPYNDEGQIAGMKQGVRNGSYTDNQKFRASGRLPDQDKPSHHIDRASAGRNLIALLSEQLNYIFTSLEDSQLRNIDYITKRYTELILKLKPHFSRGLSGLLDNFRNTPENAAKEERVLPAAEQLLSLAAAVLKGDYGYADGEERLYLDSRRFVKINLSSSGQQETVWIFNLLFYYLLEARQVFLILEEPESHLYPESQRIVSEALSLFANCRYPLLVTTHSPYVLGTFNYLLMAAQTPPDQGQEIKKRIHKRKWLDPQKAAAYYIDEGKLHHILTTEDSLTLIQNDKIDEASVCINQLADHILDQFATGDDPDDRT